MSANFCTTQLKTWMRQAGMRAWLDDIGNVHGRVDSANNPDAPVTLFGTYVALDISSCRQSDRLAL